MSHRFESSVFRAALAVHLRRLPVVIGAAALAVVSLAACSTSDGAPAAAVAPSPTPSPTAAPTETPTPRPPTPTPAPEPPTPSADSAPTSVVLSLTDASKARYRVKEQLARRNLPNDAVGVTDRVGGAIAFNADGTIDSARSRITVNLASLASDSGRRDGYIKRNTLETSRFPDAEVVVLDAPQLPWPLPDSGQVNFQLVGDTTIHGVTKPLTWEVTAEFAGARVTGVAKTSFPFDTFGMRPPVVFVVLSVEDNIRLELEFDAVIATGE